jgi:hypothetical protein
MNADSVTIHCALQNDSRLLVGLGTIFSHSANRAGLSENAQAEFTAAALDTCREAFALARREGHSDSALQIVIGEFADRIEIGIEYPGALLPASCRNGDKHASGSSAMDSAKGESHQGRSRVKLVKHVAAAAKQVTPPAK